MAVVKPFRAVRYNPDRIPDMQRVVSQPYDRIGDELQERYYQLSPYNVVRIIQGKAERGDAPEGPNPYTRARDHYAAWQQSGMLVREAQPAYYAYEQVFTVGGAEYRRLGLMAAVQLAGFDEGIVLPHERTHSGPKEDRLRLLTTLQAHTEQIFLLYPDSENKVNALIRQAIDGRAPDIDVVEIFESGVRQRVWIITQPEILGAIQHEMEPKRNLIIADGHHRYETALTYRDLQRRAHPDAPPDAAFNFVAATLVSMDDPGLVVLPTHREICNFDAIMPQELLARAGEHFAIKQVPDLPACLSAINAHPTGHAFGFYGGPPTGYHVLAIRDEDLPFRLIDRPVSREWKSLAVSILHDILLYRVAGVPESGIEDKSMIRYHRDPQEAVDNVDSGQGNFVFFVSPPPIEQIKAVAAHGEKMPQKSTDFYPKIISGLSLLPVGENERL